MNQKKYLTTIPFVCILSYAALVLLADDLAALNVHTPIPWHLLRRELGRGNPLSIPGKSCTLLYPLPGFEVFKFTAWFVIPLLFSLKRLDRGWFGLSRMHRTDWIVLAGIIVAGIGAVSIVAFIPGLRQFYPSLAGLPFSEKIAYSGHIVLYTFSWLIGWEFLHRYVLIRTLDKQWPRYGWLLVPVYETAYHVIKHPLEMIAMAVFSILATTWTRRRKNMVLPFIAHLVIELELALFMLFI